MTDDSTPVLEAPSPSVRSETTTLERAIESAEKTAYQHKQDARMLLLYMIVCAVGFLGFMLAFRSLTAEQNTAMLKDYHNALVTTDTTRVFLSTIIDRERRYYSSDDSIRLRKETQALDNISKSIKNPAPPTLEKVDPVVQYILYGALILLIGILSSFYRHHLKEASKFETYAFGLHRIRIAAYNRGNGFEGEVRLALVKDVFGPESATPTVRSQRVDSPLPGHPASDMATEVINRLLNTIDAFTKAANKSSNQGER